MPNNKTTEASDSKPETQVQPTTDETLEILKGAVQQLNDNQAQLIEMLNSTLRKVSAIDDVAYAALALHEDATFIMTEEFAKQTGARVKAVQSELMRYANAQRAIAEAKKDAKKNPIPSRLYVPRQPKGAILLPGDVSRSINKKKGSGDVVNPGDSKKG